jgi:HEAT repeat protein
MDDTDLLERVTIGTLDSPQDTGWGVLEKMAKQSQAKIRMAALNVAAKSIPDQAPMLALGLLDDLYTPVAERADALLRSRSPDERRRLLDRALAQQDVWIRHGAVSHWPSLLGRLSPQETTRWFLDAVENAASTNERMQVLAGVCRDPSLFSTDVLRALQESMQRLPSYEEGAIRAVLALCSMSQASVQEPAQVDALTETLASDDPVLRRRVATLLFWVSSRLSTSHKRGLSTTLHMVGESVDNDTAHALYKVRAVLGDRGALDALAKLSIDGDLNLRMAVVTSLLALVDRGIRLSSNDVVEAMERLLREDDTELRWRVLMVAGHTGDVRFVNSLIRLIRDRDARVRSVAAYALGQLNAQQGIDALIQAGIDDEVLAVRDASFVALHRLVHGNALPPRSLVSEWLNTPPPNSEHAFWGRDRSRWRLWHQRRGQSPPQPTP